MSGLDRTGDAAFGWRCDSIFTTDIMAFATGIEPMTSLS